MTKPIAALLSLAGLLAASEAQGQHILSGRHAARVAARSSTPTYAPVSQAASVAPAHVYPYSYYAAIPNPARGYVSYGTEDFPFHGVPYGHPYDPWTWPYLSGSYNRSLARYYDPPVK